ncbi:hypothetical protein JCM15519_27240 [Fundidesulfovibrio butyratiphilus]
MLKLCTVKELGDKRYRCYFQLTLGVLAGKWKPVILYHLALMGVMRFGELKRSIPDSTDRMLSRHLRELEADGLIHREVYRQVPPKVEYSLTPLGADLTPVLMGLRQWGVRYERHLGGEGKFTADCYEQPASPLLSKQCRGQVFPDDALDAAAAE